MESDLGAFLLIQSPNTSRVATKCSLVSKQPNHLQKVAQKSKSYAKTSQPLICQWTRWIRNRFQFKIQGSNQHDNLLHRMAWWGISAIWNSRAFPVSTNYKAKSFRIIVSLGKERVIMVRDDSSNWRKVIILPLKPQFLMSTTMKSTLNSSSIRTKRKIKCQIYSEGGPAISKHLHQIQTLFC